MSKNMLTALGTTLAEAREQADLTQDQIADRAQVSAKMPNRWENGVRWPEDMDIAAYSEATGVPIKDLWMDATRRCVDLTTTQRAVYQALRAKRRSQRLQQRSRRSPRAKPTRPADD